MLAQNAVPLAKAVVDRPIEWTCPARSIRTGSPMCRDDQVVALCEGVIDVMAALFGVSAHAMRMSERNSHAVARVRQIAMYAAHTSLGLSMKQVGTGFARDRTTVVHACHLVEDMRDDPAFDQLLAMAERVAVAAFRDRSDR